MCQRSGTHHNGVFPAAGGWGRMPQSGALDISHLCRTGAFCPSHPPSGKLLAGGPHLVDDWIVGHGYSSINFSTLFADHDLISPAI